MGAFRLAQAGGTGLLPNGRKGWGNTFVAQAFDLGEPGDGAASAQNRFDGSGAYASKRGAAPHTSFFMGGIHPRPKRAVGARLAAAARNLIYGDLSTPYTGPVLQGCSVKGGSIELRFDPQFLPGDAVAVRRSAMSAPFPLADLYRMGAAPIEAVLALGSQTYGARSDWLYSSPLEVQYGGSNLTDGVWLPANLVAKCSDAGFKDVPEGGVSGNQACGYDKHSGEPLPDIAAATASLPLGSANVTGVRCVTNDHLPSLPRVCSGALVWVVVASCSPFMLTPLTRALLMTSSRSKVRVSRRPVLSWSGPRGGTLPAGVLPNTGVQFNVAGSALCRKDRFKIWQLHLDVNHPVEERLTF